jgi:hypothetical protein
MLQQINELYLIGGILAVIGFAMIVWPRAMLEISKDEDGNPMLVTPGNVVWMRVGGVALLALAAVAILTQVLGIRGAEDPVMF